MDTGTRAIPRLTRGDVAQALKDLGLEVGHIVMVHSSLSRSARSIAKLLGLLKQVGAGSRWTRFVE